MAFEHIKIPLQTPRVVYNATAGTSSLVIPFMFFSPSDIVVTVGTTVLVQGTQYTVTPTGGFEKGFPGGVVIFTPALAAAAIVVIERHVPISRTVDFPNAGPLQTAALNTELDKGVAIDQQLDADIGELSARIDILELGDPRVGRAMLFPPEDSGPEIDKTLPAIGDRQNRLLGFKNDGNIEMFAGFVFSPSEPINNVTFPSPAGRSNKVIGFDATGAPAYTSVVAGTLIPDADNISYEAPIPTPTARSVAARLGERLSIKDFGPNVGTGVQAADDVALAAAITYFNTLPAGNDFFHTLYYPDGIYIHGPCAVALTHGNVAIRGNSEASSQIAFVAAAAGNTWLTVGDPAIARTEHVYISDLAFSVSGNANNTLLNLRNTYDVRLTDLFVITVGRLLLLGTSAAVGAYLTRVNNVRGTSKNGGVPLFDVRFGGGLNIRSCQITVAGVSDPLTTAAGTNIVTLSNSQFVGIHMVDCAFSFYEFGLAINLTTSGNIVSDLIFEDSVWQQCKTSAVHISVAAGSAVIRVRVDNNQLSTAVNDCVVLTGQADVNCDYILVRGNIMIGVGRSGVFVNTVRALGIVIADNVIESCNLGGNAQAAIDCFSGGGFTIANNAGNTLGFAHFAPNGIRIRPNQHNYNVSGNRMFGSAGAIIIEPDGVPHRDRRCFGNNNMNDRTGGFPDIFQISVDSSFVYFNTTPFNQEIIYSGGDVNAVGLGPFTYSAAPQGTFTLAPGEAITIVYAVAPLITARNLP